MKSDIIVVNGYRAGIANSNKLAVFAKIVVLFLKKSQKLNCNMLEFIM